MKGYSFWICAGIGSGLLWGINNFLISFGYSAITEMPIYFGLEDHAKGLDFPLAVAAVNDISAALALLCVYCRQWKMWDWIKRKLFSKEGAAMAVAAILGGPMGQALYCMGIMKAGSAYALAITALYPIIGCIFARIFLRQFINFRMWIGISLAVVGAITVSYTPFTAGNEVWEGILFSFGAAACWGGEIVLAVWGMQSISPELAISFREIVSGLILGTAVSMSNDARGIMCHIVGNGELLKWFVSAGIIAGFSYALWYATNHKIGCARGMAMNATFIIWGILLQVIFASSTDITLQISLGCLLVLLGVALTVLHPEDLWNRTS